MKDRKYKINRGKVFVGEVIKTGAKSQVESTVKGIKQELVGPGSYEEYRSIIFTLDETGRANDLLFHSPHYQVFKPTGKRRISQIQPHSIIVHESKNLGELLEYYGFPEELTYEDIETIRRTFFNKSFLENNCEVFGYREVQPSEYTIVSNGQLVTDPQRIQESVRYIEKQRKKGNTSFVSTGNGQLSSEYWDVLSNRSDNDLLDVLFLDKKRDAFAPHKEEGPVKKLTR